MKFYWTSFYADDGLDSFEYHGPWWVSGYELATSPDEDADALLEHRDEVGVPIVVAAVMATDQGGAYETLRLAFDETRRPTFLRRRFAEEKGASEPWSDRFPKADWMRWPWPETPLRPRP